MCSWNHNLTCVLPFLFPICSSSVQSSRSDPGSGCVDLSHTSILSHLAQPTDPKFFSHPSIIWTLNYIFASRFHTFPKGIQVSRGLCKINTAWDSKRVCLYLRWDRTPLTLCVSHKVSCSVQSNHLRSIKTGRLRSRGGPLRCWQSTWRPVPPRETPLFSHRGASSDSSLQCKISFVWLTWNPQSYHLVSLAVLLYQDLNPFII